jgi:CheY-like chemotaxis protein
MIKLLYIEDNEDNIFLFQRRLGKKGFQLVIARDGQSGVKMARTEQPALILMDLDLPVVDGWEATRQLKASPETAHIPVIAVSSYAMAQDRRRAHDAGCDDFFSKPVDMAALCARIEALRLRFPNENEGKRGHL